MSEVAEASSAQQSSTDTNAENAAAANEDAEEPLDPRIGPELERLNAAAEAVNKYENELTQSKLEINRRMHEIVAQLKEVAETVGTRRIEQARDYYDSLVHSEQVKQQLCEASAAYKLSVSRCEVAKEMLRIAEQGFLERTAADGNTAHLDFTYQEMLNHATETVVRAETERSECDQKVRELTSAAAELEIKLNLIRKEHPRSIERAAAYFELREHIETESHQRRRHCEQIARSLRRAKAEYRRALRHLDAISQEIHQKRNGLPAAAAEVPSEEEQEEEPSVEPERMFALGRPNGSGSGSGTPKERERKSSVNSVTSISSVKRPSIIELAMASARNLVEQATRTRKSVTIGSQSLSLPTDASNSNETSNANANSETTVQHSEHKLLSQQSQLSEYSLSSADKTDEFPVERTSLSGEPDAFRNELERARWRRIGDSGVRHTDSPLRVRGTFSETVDSVSETSSLASFLLDVPFEKLALNDVGEKPRVTTSDSGSLSRTSASTVDACSSNDTPDAVLRNTSVQVHDQSSESGKLATTDRVDLLPQRVSTGYYDPLHANTLQQSHTDTVASADVESEPIETTV